MPAFHVPTNFQIGRFQWLLIAEKIALRSEIHPDLLRLLKACNRETCYPGDRKVWEQIRYRLHGEHIWEQCAVLCVPHPKRIQPILDEFETRELEFGYAMSRYRVLGLLFGMLTQRGLLCPPDIKVFTEGIYQLVQDGGCDDGIYFTYLLPVPDDLIHFENLPPSSGLYL